MARPGGIQPEDLVEGLLAQALGPANYYETPSNLTPPFFQPGSTPGPGVAGYNRGREGLWFAF